MFILLKRDAACFRFFHASGKKFCTAHRAMSYAINLSAVTFAVIIMAQRANGTLFVKTALAEKLITAGNLPERRIYFTALRTAFAACSQTGAAHIIAVILDLFRS